MASGISEKLKDFGEKVGSAIADPKEMKRGWDSVRGKRKRQQGIQQAQRAAEASRVANLPTRGTDEAGGESRLLKRRRGVSGTRLVGRRPLGGM